MALVSLVSEWTALALFWLCSGSALALLCSGSALLWLCSGSALALVSLVHEVRE